jgi:ATP-binding cassette subfamily C protein CydC
MSLFKLFKLLQKNNRALILFSIILSAATIMSAVGLLSLSAFIISFCALKPSIADISLAVVGVRFFGIVRGVFRYFERLISHNITFKMLSELRVWLYKKIKRLDIYNYLLMDKEDVFTRIIDDVETLQEFYLRTFSPFLVSIIIGLVGFILLFTLNVSIAASFILFYVFAIVITPLLIWFFTNGFYKKLILQRSQQKTKIIDFISGMTDILGNSALGSWKKILSEIMKNEENTQRRIAKWKSVSNSLIMLFTNGAMVGCLFIGARLTSEGKLNGVYLAVVALGSSALFEATQAIPAMFQKLEQSKAAADRIFELASSSKEPSSTNRKELISIDNITNIRVQNIVYTYPGQREPIINDISFELEKGKKTALIGASGSGKSTLTYLLLGWLKGESGTIKLGDMKAEDFSEEAYSGLFSIVNQQVYFFNTTIKNNLKMGNSNASMESIDKALAISEIKDTIALFPKGLNTELGEGGMKLSGGERQRLAIARALLKDSSFIILDEPTAGLDMVTEKRVVEGICKEIANKGLLVITHRLVGMNMMDEILVMDKGTIVESGTEAQLISRKGLYYRMWLAQRSYLFQ